MSKTINNWKIMELFFNNPNRDFHIRESAKLIAINPMTASKYLDKFVKENLLLKRKERNNILFSANTENILFKEEKKHYNIIKIMKSGLIKYFEKELNYPKSIILFGSYAKGENIQESDIDIFIMSEIKKKFNLEKFEKILKADMQLFIYSKKEFNEMKKKNKELLNNIINGVKLSGFIEVI
tara:strand:- start:541 stop:1086 length:546 start_codon:yes stop_codon:yes gene_type:complete